MNNVLLAQFFVLLGGTIFAWVNVGLEFKAWRQHKACTTGCSPDNKVKNPLATPCFWGAVFFAIAFVLNILVIRGY